MKDSTEVVLLIDKSGSMSHIRDSVVSSVNEFLADQAREKGECMIRVAAFSDRFTPGESFPKTIREGESKKINPISMEEYVPSGMTCLADAMVMEMHTLGARLAALPESDRPKNVIFVVVTDGGENSSSPTNVAKVKEMVKHQESKYSWKFMFLASGIDAINTANSYNLRHAVNAYCNTAKGYNSAIRGVSNFVSSTRKK